MATAAPADRSRPAIPPWLWLWSVFFILSLSGVLATWRSSLQGLSLLHQSVARLREVDPSFGRLSFLLYPSVLLDILPTAALCVGLLTVLLPWLRAAYVEKRYRLRAIIPSLPAVAEIREYVQRYGPPLEIRANLARANLLAFAYPTGYRRAALALFGGLIVLWRSDREAAEAVLLHEIAHCRRGDALYIGVGSFLEYLLKVTVFYYLLLFVLPSVILMAEQLLSARVALGNAGISPNDLLLYQLTQMATFGIRGPVLITLSYLFRLLAYLALPLAAIWSAELGADLWVAGITGSADGVCRALHRASGRASWWRWVLFRLSHPPNSLRAALLRCRGAHGIAWALPLFPAGYLFKLLALHLFASLTYASAGYAASEIWLRTISNTRAYLAGLPLPFLAMSALILGWPHLMPYWERLYGYRGPAAGRAGRVYLGCAAFLALVAGLAYIGR